MNINDARQFLELLFSHLPGLIEVRAIALDGKVRRRFCKTIPEALSVIERLSNEIINVYVGPATRRTNRNGKKENLAACRVLWVDVDFKKAGDRERLEAALKKSPFPPSLIVESGGGMHLYWLLIEPYALESEESIVRLENVLRGLVSVLGGDSAVTDASHVMRVAGTTNHPNAKKRASGRTRTLTRIIG